MKRFLDVALGTLILVLASPVMICIAMLIWAKLGRPIFFTQLRPGLHGEPFLLIKFRTMSNEAAGRGKIMDDSERLSNFGKALRRHSLDELPELANVIRGEMSLVGPRPLLMEYLPLYDDFQSRRHEVRPGLTGFAQIRGRNSLSWEEKFELDVWYVDNQSLLLDLKIIALTAGAVIRPKGITMDGHATMPKFEGSPRRN